MAPATSRTSARCPVSSIARLTSCATVLLPLESVESVALRLPVTARPAEDRSVWTWPAIRPAAAHSRVRIYATQPRLERADVPVQIERQFPVRPIDPERSAGAHGDAPDRHRPVLDLESAAGQGGAKSALQRDWHVEHHGIDWGHVQVNRQ